MLLTQEEAICLVLNFSKNKRINSQTKLNKLIARLNLFMVPTEIGFKLNKYGSCDAELDNLNSNDFFDIEPYEYNGKTIPKYSLNPEGEKLAENTEQNKISKILDSQEIQKLKEKIEYLSSINSSEIAEDEHLELFVDVDDRHKLIERINFVYTDLLDLYRKKINEIKEDSITNVSFAALIEYCHFLSKFLKEKKFRNIEENTEYGYNDDMKDYYLLFNLEKIIPFLKQQITEEKKDNLKINKYYQYFVHGIKDYEFSLENPKLQELIR